MKRKLIALILALTFALACLPAVAENGLVLTDMTGREINLEAPATRVVALSPADCEIIYALGAQDVLVGRGEYCNYPEEVTALPSVNSGANTNVEQVLALEPQVIVMSTMAQTEEQVEALEKAGVRVVISDAQNIEGVYEAISMIGSLTGKTEEADSLIADMRMGFDDIAQKAQASEKTVYFEVSPLEWGLWTAGANTFMDELAQICGLTNAFADVSGWAEISQEQVIERNPDYIVTTTGYYNDGPTPVEEIRGRSGWENMKAVQNGNVYNADSDSVSRPGPRLLDAAQALFDFVNGADAEEPAA